MCHGIAEYALCKSEAVTPQAKGVTTEVTPQAKGPPTSPQMTPTSPQMSPLMSSPSSASLDMPTNSQSTNATNFFQNTHHQGVLQQLTRHCTTESITS